MQADTDFVKICNPNYVFLSIREPKFRVRRESDLYIQHGNVASFLILFKDVHHTDASLPNSPPTTSTRNSFTRVSGIYD